MKYKTQPKKDCKFNILWSEMTIGNWIMAYFVTCHRSFKQYKYKSLQIRHNTDNLTVLYKIYFATNSLVMSNKYILWEKVFVNQNRTDK